MNQFRLVLYFLLLSCLYPSLGVAQSLPAIEKGIEKQTFAFVDRDSTLYLDFYQLEGDDQTKPCLIFIFGGGFAKGRKDLPYYYEYYNFLVNSGIKVAAIDYRLLLRKKGNEVGVFNTKPLEEAIDYAVSDLFAATSFLIEKADDLAIDPSQILISGSSAGAITSLQADWYNQAQHPLAKTLPENFSYKGVIAFAGAIFSTQGKPKYDGSPAPTLFFHGTDDKTVPYKKRQFLRKGFFGSYQLAKWFSKAGYNYTMYSIEGAGHKIAGSPIYNYQPEILQFIQLNVIQGKPTQTDRFLADKP
ncbi:MAG: carboxylesterase family protein [Saprospiraceae bacterium]|nr:carboxylesterase family protein [Saprospiraceae bacterium]